MIRICAKEGTHVNVILPWKLIILVIIPHFRLLAALGISENVEIPQELKNACCIVKNVLQLFTTFDCKFSHKPTFMVNLAQK